MGTWGSGSFENDTAMDWLFQLGEETGIVCIARALVVNEGTDWQEGIAAAEALSALFSEQSIRLPKEVRKWLKRANTEEAISLVSRAVAFLNHILDGGTDIYAVWQDAGENSFREWEATILDLRNRLQELMTKFTLQNTDVLRELPVELFPDFDKKLFSNEVATLISTTVDKLMKECRDIEIYSVYVNTSSETVREGKNLAVRLYTEVFLDTEENHLEENARLRLKVDDQAVEYGRWEVPGRFAKPFFTKIIHSQMQPHNRKPWPVVIECMESLNEFATTSFCVKFAVHPDAEIWIGKKPKKLLRKKS